MPNFGRAFLDIGKPLDGYLLNSAYTKNLWHSKIKSCLALSLRRSLSYRNQSIDLHRISVWWQLPWWKSQYIKGLVEANYQNVEAYLGPYRYLWRRFLWKWSTMQHHRCLICSEIRFWKCLAKNYFAKII